MSTTEERGESKKRPGLRTRTFVLVGICALVPVLVLSVLYLFSYRAQQREQLEQQAELAELALSHTSEWSSEERQRLLHALVSGADASELVYLALYDEQGARQEVSSVTKLDAPDDQIECPTQRSSHGQQEGLFERVSPLASGGCVRSLFLEHEARASFRARAQQTTLLALLLVLLVAFAGTSLVDRQVIRPIMELASSVRRFSDSEFVPDEEGLESDELGSLARGFELMSERMVANIAELAEREEQLGSTLNAIPDALVATNTLGNVEWMNPVAEALTGVSRSDAEGRSLDALLTLRDPETRSPAGVPVRRLLRSSGTKGIVAQRILIDGRGEERRVALAGTSMRNSKGEIVGVVVVVRDVTEEYRLQSQLSQHQKLDAIGLLAGGIAHDFNNMLAGILGGAELLGEHTAADQDAQIFVEMITDAASRSAELTSKLLAFSRKGPAVNRRLELNKAARDAVALLSRSIDKRVQIEVALEADPSMVLGDAAQLQSIIINLGVNASHAMPEGGQLRIATQTVELAADAAQIEPFQLAGGTFVELEVRDSGTGIAADLIKHIFDPFFTTKQEGKGTGLGLAAVYGIVKQHEGAVSVESEVGVGTCFRVYLPLAEGPALTDSGQMLVRGSGRILLVDDEKLARMAAKGLLEGLGYEVVAAESGREAIATYADKHASIELVMLDMVMPDMSGVECFAKLREINPAVGAILCSGHARQEDVDEMFSAGLLTYLPKPYRRVQLSRVIADGFARVRGRPKRRPDV